MEAAIRWSPHHIEDDAQFLLLDILNSVLSLHKLSHIDRRKVVSKQIATFNKLPTFAAFDWSKTTPNIVSIGQVSGSASLVRLSPTPQTSEVIITHKAKQQRRCNSTALSTQDWLAVALDKTRSDLCLNIYDAASTSSEPVRRLCPAELISSVRFFSTQPQEILAGAQRAFIRLYDLRDGFAAGSGNSQVATKNVNNIAIDPLDENYFAAGGSIDDPSVTVWDKRKLSSSSIASDAGAVFHFRPAIDNTNRASVWSLRYSGSRRGRLALCSSAGELKIIDMAETYTASSKSDYQPSITYGGAPWTDKRYVKETRVLERSNSKESHAPASEYAIAFDWMPATQDAHKQSMIVLRSNHNVETVEVSSHLALDLSSSNTMSVIGKELSVLNRHSSFVDDVSISGLLNQLGIEVDDARPYNLATLDSPLIHEVLHSDIQQSRCEQGYSFVCAKNIAITADSEQLQHLWRTIQQLKTLAAHDGMVYESIDFSYVGINGIWSEQAGMSPQRRLSPSPTKPSEAIIGLNDKRELPLFEGERTDYAEHRQLCLAVCGWKFHPEDLEQECQELVEKGLYYQAIVQAVLHGAKHLALNLLRTLIRGKTIPNIGLGALLAATELNEDQREMTQWMAADTEDPALKALLTFLHSGDWRDVMKTRHLHLGYRLALGLKYLNDTELNGFIQSETARAIKNGDLEGILLTGLTEQAMDLFQTYIVKTNDLQTAVLATALTNPLYVDDARWEMWKETYFMQMQAWRAFAQRARFIVEHNQMSKTREGRILAEPVAPPAKLRCVHCHQDLKRPSRDARSRSRERHKPSTPADHAGTVCHSCGRSLPRCSICMLWIGAPDPRRAQPVVRKSKNIPGNDLMAKMVVFCTSCEHSSHAHHARDWFAEYDVCPVPGCACRCSNGPTTQGFSIADIWQQA